MKFPAIRFAPGSISGSGKSLLKRASQSRDIGSLDDQGAEEAHWSDRLPCWTGFAALMVGIVVLDGCIVLFACWL